MEPKDFAMREAEQLDYAYRLPLYSTMELFIETLTGTCFELRVSPYETVISVKAKIQRLEGIPISQQYLIWQNVELEDEYCLHDYNITDGCTLKLVLAMRGGPINTRRIAMEDPGFSEMADYIDSREELLEKLSPPPSGGNGGKQVTLLVYRDGDQLNFFRVVDRGDGTLTPFSESLSESAYNLREDEEDELSEGQSRKPSRTQLSVAQMVENNITAAKMKQIRSQMQNLHLNDTSNLKKTQQSPSLIKLNSTLSRPNSTKRKPKQIPERKSNVAVGLPEKSDELSVLPVIDNKGDEPAHPTNIATTSRVVTKRAQLKRMNAVESRTSDATNETTSRAEIQTNFNTEGVIESSAKKAAEVEAKPKLVVEKEDASGRFSPRTRRLLNALENTSTHQRKKTSPAQKTAYKSPRSSMLQGMTFNRHDMYLRSYGLIASPDDASDERVASSASGEVPQPEESDETKKVYETSQGVKYSAFPAKAPSFGPGSRLLKSPPDWISSKDALVRSNQPSGSTWHATPQPPQLGTVRNVDRPLRAPSTSTHLPTEGAFPSNSFFDTMGRNSRNYSKLENEHATKSSTPKHWQKLDALHLPQPPPPPSTSSTAANSTWHKQRLRRLNLVNSSPNKEGASGRTTPVIESQPSKESFSSRRSFAPASSTSGIRMKESSNGKVESMSREEAREVVDFINKAVDASILRTLVRSPVKDGKRGNSGHNSRRMSASNLQTPRSGVRGGKLASGPPILPPVKPASKKKRCFQCAKRTGLASSYTCRCGNNFCATHRYAESHNCTYDYKTSGRKLLEEANPLVSAPKLPKI